MKGKTERSNNEMLELFITLFPEHNFRWRWGDESAVGICPFHEDRSPSLSVYKKGNKWRWWCYADQFGGAEVDVVMRAKGCTRGEANRWLGANGYVQETEAEVAERERQEVLTSFYKYLNSLLVSDPRAAGVRAYLVSRNIPTALLPQAAIGWYPPLEEVAVWLEQNGVRSDIRHELLVDPKAKKKAKMAPGSIAFFYRSSFDQFSRIKLRNVMQEQREKEATGEKKVKAIFVLGVKNDDDRDFGFFTPLLTCNRAEQALIVEGEFDAFAIFATSWVDDPQAEEPVYSFGSGANLDKGVGTLTHAGVKDVYVFPDNDEKGLDYVFQATIAHPHTFVIYPEDYQEGSDPADWAMDHVFKDLKCAFNKRISAPIWFGRQLATQFKDGTQEDQSHAREKILQYARKLTPSDREMFLKEFAPLAGVTPEALMSELTDLDHVRYKANLTHDNFGIYMLTPGPGKEPPFWERISNVIIEFVKDILYDDGDGMTPERDIILRLMMADRTVTATISAKELVDMRLFEAFLTQHLGSAVWFKPKSLIFLKESATMLSMETAREEELVYRHTGWRDRTFYMPNGYVDVDGFHTYEETGVRVELPKSTDSKFFDRYSLASPPANIEEAAKSIRENLLQCYSYNITLPALAHVFLAPLICMYPMVKPVCMWFYGRTGSQKTSFAGCLNAFFGEKFAQVGELQNWGSTVNAIEKCGFFVKDVLYLIDDYKKSVVREDQVVHLIQKYGDRAARARLNSNCEMQKLWPIRGLLLSTGEDIPTGEASTLARCLIVKFNKAANSAALMRAQKAAAQYPGLMAKFIQYLAGVEVTQEQAIDQVRERQAQFHDYVTHPRAQESLVANSIAWDYVAKFMGLEDLTPQYYQALRALASSMGEYVQEEQASNMFLDMLREIIATKQYYLEGMGVNSTDHADNATLLGWVTKDQVLLPAKTVIGVINHYQFQTYGHAMKYSPHAIYDQLSADGLLVLQGGKPTGSTHIQGTSIRVLKLRKEVLLDTDENAQYQTKLVASEVRAEEDAPLLQ